jgi:nitrogen regulatory protein P-II 1
MKGGSDMKLVKVIIRPEKKFALKDALVDMGCHGITTKECSGFAESKKTIKEVYGGRVYEQRSDVVKREEMEFVVPANKVKEVLEKVQLVAATDDGADGRIYVKALEESVHIHNGKEHTGDENEFYLNLKEDRV